MYLVEEIVHSRLRHREAHAEDVKQEDNRSTNELVENGPVCPVNGHTHSHSHR